jgi:hypothetical protein
MRFWIAAATAALFVAGASCAAAQDAAPAQGSPQVKVTPLFSATTTAIGQPIVLPKENAEVRVTLYEIAVGGGAAGA